MSQVQLEYTLCQIQRDIVSFARRSHREEGGDPRLEILVETQSVTWRLLNIDGGILQTVAGTPRADRIDFYFRVAGLATALSSLPRTKASIDPALRFEPVTSVGSERKDGKRVRMLVPVCRFHPITDIALFANTSSAFRATAAQGTLHLDMESGPKKIYGTELFEVHFGVEAVFDTRKMDPPLSSSAEFKMTPSMYATILSELKSAA